MLPQDWKSHIVLDNPNLLQRIALVDVEPSKMNVRLFIERESLEMLGRRYREWQENSESTVLPDAPIVRWRGKNEPFELIAGHRRIQAGHNEDCSWMWMRVCNVDDETAYKLIREANNYEALTTIEKAYSVAEMSRLGFPADSIRETMGNIGINRYLQVGRLVDPDWFTDAPKLCNPSISIWGYAARHGHAHFHRCFRQWDAGVWDEEDCSREFRRYGHAKPPEPYQAGAILSIDRTGKVLRFRGTLDLEQMTPDQMNNVILEPFFAALLDRMIVADELNHFGNKMNYQFQIDYESPNET